MTREDSPMFFHRALISLFAIALANCAGSGKPAEKQPAPDRTLFKTGSFAANKQFSKLPDFAQSTIAGIMDSIPREYFYSTEGDKIDSIFRKDREKYEFAAAILYDSLDGDKNYTIKSPEQYYYVKEGKLYALYSKDTNGVETLRTYYGNNQINAEARGKIKIKDGDISIVQGEIKEFHKNGILRMHQVSQSESLFTSKSWNESGTLVKEVDYPKKYKEYWDNGQTKMEIDGKIEFANKSFDFKRGTLKRYFENGTKELEDIIENDSSFRRKVWNTNGVLIKEDNTQGTKEYWDNGTVKLSCQGDVSRLPGGRIKSNNFDCKFYFEDGHLNKTKVFGDNSMILEEWDKNGVLKKKINYKKDSPSEFHEYWDNGKTKKEMSGIFSGETNDNDISFSVKKGTYKLYFEDGKIQQEEIHESEDSFTSKIWNASGSLVADIHYPDEYKLFYENGKTQSEMKGKFHINENAIPIPDSGQFRKFYKNGNIEIEADGLHFLDYGDSSATYFIKKGSSKSFYENGKTRSIIRKSDKGDYGEIYNESGILLKKIDFHDSSTSEVLAFWEDGKKKSVTKGIITFAEQDIFDSDYSLMQGEHAGFYENGNPQITLKQLDDHNIVQKIWRMDGTPESELDTKAGIEKNYYDNGNLQAVFSGSLYVERDEQDKSSEKVKYVSGTTKAFHANGQLQKEITHKNSAVILYKEWNSEGTLLEESSYDSLGHLVSAKRFNDDGTLAKEISFPDYVKYFFDDGTLKYEMSGTLYHNEAGAIETKNGHTTFYYENGNTKTEWTYKNGLCVRYKYFLDDGTISQVATGILDMEREQLRDGTLKEFDSDGNPLYTSVFVNYKRISQKKE